MAPACAWQVWELKESGEISEYEALGTVLCLLVCLPKGLCVFGVALVADNFMRSVLTTSVSEPIRCLRHRVFAMTVAHPSSERCCKFCLMASYRFHLKLVSRDSRASLLTRLRRFCRSGACRSQAGPPRRTQWRCVSSLQEGWADIRAVSDQGLSLSLPRSFLSSL